MILWVGSGRPEQRSGWLSRPNRSRDILCVRLLSGLPGVQERPFPGDGHAVSLAADRCQHHNKHNSRRITMVVAADNRIVFQLSAQNLPRFLKKSCILFPHLISAPVGCDFFCFRNNIASPIRHFNNSFTLPLLYRQYKSGNFF